MNHVAFVIPTLNRMGGAERQMLALAHGFAQRGWRVSIVALSGTTGDATAGLESAGIGYVSLQMRNGLADPRGWLWMNAWLQQNRPDVLHAHLPHAAWMGRWSRLAVPVRVVVDTIHTANTGTAGRKAGYAASGWLADCVTAVSESAGEAWAAAGMVAREKLALVPNGIDTEQWRPDAEARAQVREELGLGSEFLWLAAGRLEPVKDFSSLLDAMTALPMKAHLVLAGSGSLAGELQALARSLGVADRVQFTGFKPNLPLYMQAADGFVLSSLWEGLPMSLLEAGSCGLPAVSTAVAGATEILRDGQTGFLVPPRSTEALQNAMRRLMQMQLEERAAMGAAARERVSALYSMRAVLDRWEALYAELLERHPRPARTGFMRAAQPAGGWQAPVSGTGVNAGAR